MLYNLYKIINNYLSHPITSFDFDFDWVFFIEDEPFIHFRDEIHLDTYYSIVYNCKTNTYTFTKHDHCYNYYICNKSGLTTLRTYDIIGDIIYNSDDGSLVIEQYKYYLFINIMISELSGRAARRFKRKNKCKNRR